MRKTLISIMLLLSSVCVSQNIVTVTDCNLNGWLKQPIGKSSLGFIKDGTNPPLGKGSLQFVVPEGGVFWPGDFVRFRNGQFSGTALSSLTELGYSTYIEERDTIADIHFLVVLSDINGDSSAEHNLVFDPRYQNPTFIKGTMPNQGNTKEYIWQNWDALHGGWFYGGNPDTDPDHNGPFFTLKEYLAQYPNASIRNDAAKGGPAIRLTAGGVVFKPNFLGSADNFKIGVNGNTTIYDFEFGIADAGADKHVFYGYGSNCVMLNGKAAGGVAPYNYSWSSGTVLSYNASMEVCATVTTNYTFTVKDTNGCTNTDELTVFVNDVRCGSKLDRVLLCHKGNEICVPKEAVPAHLNHGDQLGKCDGSDKVQTTRSSMEIMPLSAFKLTGYPNPFVNATSIEYVLPSDGRLIIKLYDISGKELRTLISAGKKAGTYKMEFARGNLTPGTYYARAIFHGKFEDHAATQRLVIVSGQ
ncbi:MAG TPA: T9SS type A sorting domain-containing protein [Chitinophagaceae bacterium]|nr:T9SS type A sorting domain-containing protein [Chitinophagaceae bacterium]